MKPLKSMLVFWLFAVLVLPSSAWSQALPVAQPDRVGRAVSGAIQDGMRSRGFAANDPRFASTLARVSPQLATVAGSAATVTVGAVTAPGWASVALAVGIGAVITYAVNLGLDALVRWLFRTDGKIDESGENLAIPTSTAMTAGGAYWKVSFHSAGVNVDLAGGDGEAVARQGYYEYRSQTGQDTQAAPSCSITSTQVTCGVIYAIKQATGAPASCPAGSLYKNGACGPYTFTAPAAVPTKAGLSPQQATNDIPAADLDKRLNTAIVAALANRAWQQAASQPGYDGLPYPQSNPIRADEVGPWMEANPDFAPTVRDFTAPNPTTSSNPQPWSLPQNPTSATTTPAQAPNATNPAAANPLQNLGPDPGIGAPTLEQTPTAYQIAKPVLDLLPGLRSFQPQTQAGVCPRPTIELYGSHTLDAHCRLIDENKSIIQTAMVFAWAALALFIILSA